MKRFSAATVAAATALTLVAMPAQAAENEIDTVRETVEGLKLIGIFADKGVGAAPDTELAGEWAFGSVAKGSSAEEAYRATQAGWGILWAVLAVAGLGAIGFGAQQAGLLPNLPF